MDYLHVSIFCIGVIGSLITPLSTILSVPHLSRDYPCSSLGYVPSVDGSGLNLLLSPLENLRYYGSDSKFLLMENLLLFFVLTLRSIQTTHPTPFVRVYCPQP